MDTRVQAFASNFRILFKPLRHIFMMSMWNNVKEKINLKES